MSVPRTTTFSSRGKLSGVLRQAPLPAEHRETQGPRAEGGLEEMDTQAYEALYYRARLILGDSLPRPRR